VAADSKNQGLTQPAMPQMFLNDVALSQGSEMAFVARFAGAEPLFTGAVRAALRELNPALLAKFETLDQAISRMSAGSRFNSALVGSFAVIAFVMAIIGVYGVLAFAVARRSQEIGIRMALGATPGKIQRVVLKEGIILVAIGTVLGFVLSLPAGRYLKVLLYDVGGTDMRTYVAMVLAIGMAGIAAAWLPARRAASVDPTVTLRNS
jgi:putative ABC transport system permease protein